MYSETVGLAWEAGNISHINQIGASQASSLRPSVKQLWLELRLFFSTFCPPSLGFCYVSFCFSLSLTSPYYKHTLELLNMHHAYTLKSNPSEGRRKCKNVSTFHCAPVHCSLSISPTVCYCHTCRHFYCYLVSDAHQAA